MKWERTAVKKEIKNSYTTLLHGFSWGSTKEKEDFWLSLYDNLSNKEDRALEYEMEKHGGSHAA